MTVNWKDVEVTYGFLFALIDRSKPREDFIQDTYSLGQQSNPGSSDYMQDC
jgi:hypothetical protein